MSRATQADNGPDAAEGLPEIAPDQIGDTLAEPAAALVREWLAAGEAALSRRERRERRRFQLLTGDARSLAFTMSFCDRVLRAESASVAAAQLCAVAAGPPPPFLSAFDRLLLRAGVRLAAVAPGVVMPLTRRRLRQIVGRLVVDRDDPGLGRHLRRLREAGFDVNVNLLGEYVLGDEEAERRLCAILGLIKRSDIDYVSVKASAVASQLNLWGYDQTLERVKRPLRRLFLTATTGDEGSVATFVNCDMEEYRDLRLTVDAFKALLEEPELRSLDAGIVLQAYLPDSFDVLRELVEWADRRAAAGGGGIKVRVVKGANLAMEAVDAVMHGWQPAPYATKVETDANYKRMLDWAFDPKRLSAVRIGVASHNLFDVAWARLLAQTRGVAERVELEMLQGMAPGIDRAVLAASGHVRLYTPVVAAADFDSALAYLFRRLEENSSGENFLRRSFDLSTDEAAFAAERERFETSLARRWQVSSRPRRRGLPEGRAAGFENAVDSDPTDPQVRERAIAAVDGWSPAELPAEVTQTAGIDGLLGIAAAAAEAWAAAPGVRRDLLRRVAVELSGRRPQLLAVMAHEACKTLGEGDGEVSEAIDMAAYYAEHVPGLESDARAVFTPLGVVLVTPPWNFPLAIPAGGVLAALAAGNAVVLKAPPQTPQCALAIADAVWVACRALGVTTDVLQYVRCPEEVVGEHLVAHPKVAAIVLTGARETAQLFARLAPRTPLFAETSGKNALVVMPDADLDLAASDLVHSAFGHAGQKCSAASLGICVGDVYDSARFRRQLVDAAASLVLGPAQDPSVTLAPLIGPPASSLSRALTRLDPGESWLLEPRLVDANRNLWSPGIKLGVRPGSWFHQTECFGPVLGLMQAADLEAAIRLQNGTRFGLTGGIHTLDPVAADRWLERVQVGNAYINRVTTGAIVARQPFGGWKESVVGPGAKAGGPNYVAQLGAWRDEGLPIRGKAPARALLGWLTDVTAGLGDGPREWLEAAVRSDEYWRRDHFDVDHDPSGLFCEANVFCYRPLGRVVMRIERDADPAHVVRVIAAARAAGCAVDLSASSFAGLPERIAALTRPETGAELAARLLADPPDRVRVIGTRATELTGLELPCFIDDRPVVADGRIEGLRYRREQAISRTLHRFGTVTLPKG